MDFSDYAPKSKDRFFCSSSPFDSPPPKNPARHVRSFGIPPCVTHYHEDQEVMLNSDFTANIGDFTSWTPKLSLAYILATMEPAEGVSCWGQFVVTERHDMSNQELFNELFNLSEYFSREVKGDVDNGTTLDNFIDCQFTFKKPISFGKTISERALFLPNKFKEVIFDTAIMLFMDCFPLELWSLMTKFAKKRFFDLFFPIRKSILFCDQKAHHLFVAGASLKLRFGDYDYIKDVTEQLTLRQVSRKVLMLALQKSLLCYWFFHLVKITYQELMMNDVIWML